jgi:hypothetical protein
MVPGRCGGDVLRKQLAAIERILLLLLHDEHLDINGTNDDLIIEAKKGI